MENEVKVKGVGFRALWGLFVEKVEDDIPKGQKTSGGEEMNLVWKKVWDGITKRGMEITEKQVTSPKLKDHKVRVKVEKHERGKSEYKEIYQKGKDNEEKEIGE